jgi:hypothetical protein
VPDRLPNLAEYLEAPPVEGSGIPGSPFEIYTTTQLRQVGRGSNAIAGYTDWTLDAHYKLMQNITLTDTNNWTPIGDSTDRFTGSFDGNGRTIAGIHINTSSSFHQGMFGFIGAGGLVENLTMQNIYIRSGGRAGSLAGEITDAIVRNCTFRTIQIEGTGSSKGGMAGRINASDGGFSSSISNIIMADAIVTSTANWIGGLVGAVDPITSEIIISNCYIDASVTGRGVVGIITGTIGGSDFVLENVLTRGVVISTDPDGIHVGGIAGMARGVIRNNVALNTSISNMGTALGRVVGAGGTRTNNYARTDMDARIGTNADGTGGTQKVITSALDSPDGLSITATQWEDRAWWTAQGFIDPWWDNNGLLPITNISGASASLAIGLDLDFDEYVICEPECECFVCDYSNSTESDTIGPDPEETDNPDSDITDTDDPDNELNEPQSSPEPPYEFLVILPVFGMSAIVGRGRFKRLRHLLYSLKKRS